jgi:hypothetical protein
MYGYADALAREFKGALSGHRASDDQLTAWETQPGMETVKDWLDTVGLGQAGGALTWSAYLKLETRVLRLITAATLGERPPDVDEDTDKKPIAEPSALTPAMSSPPRG